MMYQISRRSLLAGLAGVAAIGLPGHAVAASDQPPALLAFDDETLAAGARALLASKGFGIQPVDLRERSPGFTEIGRAGVLVVAQNDAGEARAFARSTAKSFNCKLMIYGKAGWSYHVYSPEQNELCEALLDEGRAAAVLDAAASDYANRPKPMIIR